jgi:hypothetical protein
MLDRIVAGNRAHCDPMILCGRYFYVTASKNLSSEIRLPVAPYAGMAYSSYEHRFLPTGGLNINWRENFSSQIIFDGVKVHPTLNYTTGRHVFTFLLRIQDSVMISHP